MFALNATDAPKLTAEPPPLAAALVQVVPLLVKTFPFVPGATNVTAEVPLPRMTLFAVRVEAPVPPLATGTCPLRAVPAGMAVKVFVEPLMLLFVRVSVDALPTNVSAAAGRFQVIA